MPRRPRGRPSGGGRGARASPHAAAVAAPSRPPPPTVSRSAGRRQEPGLSPGDGGGGGAWTDPAMPTSAGRRGGGGTRALPCEVPGRRAPLRPQPRTLLSLGRVGEERGGGSCRRPPPPPPRQLGLGVKTVIAVPDRVAAAARLLPAAARTGTASPGPTGVTDPLGGGGRSRVSPPPQGRAGQLLRAARFSGVSVSLAYFVSARGECPPSEQFTFNSI